MRLALHCWPPQNACKRPVGSCLGGQLTNLAAADKARSAAGSTPLYMISRYGGGATNAKQVWAERSRRHRQGSLLHQLLLPLLYMHPVLLTLPELLPAAGTRRRTCPAF